MRILLPLSPGSSTPRRLQLTYSSPLPFALSFLSLASYTTARSPAFSTTAVRCVDKSTCCFTKRKNWPSIRKSIHTDLKSGKCAIVSVSLPLTLSFAGSLTCCQLSNLNQHLFFRGVEGLAKKSCFPPLAPLIGYRTMFNLMVVNFLQPWTEALRSIKHPLSSSFCGSFYWWSWQTLSGIPPLHLVVWSSSGHTFLSALTVLSGVINKTKQPNFWHCVCLDTNDLRNMATYVE